ncbi:unnamed protein product [Effrenium voratum]|uniref:C3H1-type domain-containing protein n=1 Tax=Effrenium voratum TaxID=2562239 RepID=A0AA36J427_9DINO|nr:unnamed protein product [Effrenium voratum]
MHLAADVDKVFDVILKAVQKGHEVLANSAQEGGDRLSQYEAKLAEQKALIEQLSAEASRRQHQHEEQVQQLQILADEKRDLADTVKRLNEEVAGLRQQVSALQEHLDRSQNALLDQAATKVTQEAPAAPQEPQSSSRSSSPTSVTEPGAAGAPAEEPPEPSEAPAVEKEAPPVPTRSSRSQSRPLVRRERLRSMSPGELHQRSRKVIKRADSRQPLARHQEERRRERSARLVREERQRSRHQAARGQPRSPRINRTKACIPWCAKICAKGDHCPLWHPVPEEAAQILERVQRTPCRDGKDCQRTRCHFLHPGQQGDRQRKSAKDRR